MKKQNSGEISARKMASLIKSLKDGDSFKKEKAIEVLVSSPSKSVIEHVIPLLDGHNTQARMSAWEILKKVGHYNIDAVAQLLDHESEDIRVYAAEILGYLKEKSTLPRLITKIHDESPNVRNIACMALGGFDDELAVNALLESLHDDDWIAFSAIESLGNIGNRRAIQPLLDVMKNGSEEVSLVACEVLIGFNSDETKNQVFDILKGWDSERRGACINVILEKVDNETFEGMKQRMGEEVFEHLLSRVKNDNRKTINLIRLLGQFRRMETCEAILNVLRLMDSDNEEYEEVLEIFSNLGDVWKDRIPAYIELGGPYIMPVIRGCKMAGLKIDETLLLEVFLSASVDVKREIIKNLPALSDGDGIIILKEAMRDPDGHVRGDAFIIIGKMSLKTLLDDVVNAVKKDFLDVRIKALMALMTLDYNAGLELIEKLVNEGSSDDKRLYLAVARYGNADNNLPFVERLLSDNDDKIRRAIIDVIGQFLDDERYMAIFVKLFMDKDTPHEALKIIKEKRLVVFKDRLQDIFNNTGKELWTRYYALSALSAFEDSSLFDAFVNGLGDENSIIRIGCMKALADLNNPVALKYIYPFVQSDDDDIRSTAEFVISRLEEL
jgi:HEAT repeat protein